jgi:hypothetical protein
MKYHRIAAAWALALSPVLYAFALGGCDLFAEDPPRLVIENASPGPITSVAFWEETAELEEINTRFQEAVLKQFTDFDNLPIHMAESIAILIEYIIAAGKVAQTTPPLIKDDTVIPSGGSRSWDLETDKTYIARINRGLHPVSMNRGSIDTVYVFDGNNVSEKR